MTPRLIILLLVAPLPWFIRRIVFTWGFGFKLGKGTYIGPSLLDTQSLEMAEGSRIGWFNIVRNMESVVLGNKARLGTFNWIAGFRSRQSVHFGKFPGRRSALEIQDAAAITARHLIDCTDRIVIGRFSTVAGHRSQFLTHGIDFRENMQACAPIIIGEYCFIGTGSILLKGVQVPDCTVIAAGSVVSQKIDQGGYIYAGNPAAQLRPIDRDSGYFTRETGVVG